MYIITDDTGRVCASSPVNCMENAIEIEMPEGFDGENQYDWRLVGETLTYDPEPGESTPSVAEQIAALEAQNTMLTECLLEISGLVYA